MGKRRKPGRNRNDGGWQRIRGDNPGNPVILKSRFRPLFFR
jgi:hypothetical protein